MMSVCYQEKVGAVKGINHCKTRRKLTSGRRQSLQCQGAEVGGDRRKAKERIVVKVRLGTVWVYKSTLVGVSLGPLESEKYP